MKKTKLKNIIKESIKELMNEQGTGPVFGPDIYNARHIFDCSETLNWPGLNGGAFNGPNLGPQQFTQQNPTTGGANNIGSECMRLELNGTILDFSNFSTLVGTGFQPLMIDYNGQIVSVTGQFTPSQNQASGCPTDPNLIQTYQVVNGSGLLFNPKGPFCPSTPRGGEDPCKDNPNESCYWCFGETSQGGPCVQVGGNLQYALNNGFNLYSTQADCTAAEPGCERIPPVEEVKCACCDKDGLPISMQQMVPANPGCTGAENTYYAGLGVTNCALHQASGGPGPKCKKPPVGNPDMPNLMFERFQKLANIKK